MFAPTEGRILFTFYRTIELIQAEGRVTVPGRMVHGVRPTEGRVGAARQMIGLLAAAKS